AERAVPGQAGAGEGDGAVRAAAGVGVLALAGQGRRDPARAPRLRAVRVAAEVAVDDLHDDRRGRVGADASVLDEGDDDDLGRVGRGVGGEPGVVLGEVEADV